MGKLKKTIKFFISFDTTVLLQMVKDFQDLWAGRNPIFIGRRHACRLILLIDVGIFTVFMAFEEIFLVCFYICYTSEYMRDKLLSGYNATT